MPRRKKPTPPPATSDRTTDYARAVTEGRIVAGPYVRAACARHLRDLDEAPARGLRWDVDAAAWICGFFEDVLVLNGGQYEGAPFRLHDWQAFVVGSLWGWKRADGARRFRVAYVETGKGSGKSPLAAGIGLAGLTVDDEPRAEVYAAATKKEQAKVLFRDAVAMVQQSPHLARRVAIAGGDDPNNLAFHAGHGFFRPIASEDRGRGQSGPRPHIALLDEVHEHATNAMIEFMRAGVKARRQPLTFMITNSGESPQSVGGEYHDLACRVATGEVQNDEFFSYVCALDEGDDPIESEECWIKANPSLPEIPGYDYLRGQVAEARGLPSKLAIVRRLNFCQWVSGSNPLFERETWDRALHDLVLDEYRGRPCWLAIDLSSVKDLTAMAIAFRRDDGGLDLFVEYWTPAETLAERQRKDRAPYAAFVNGGHLVAIPGKAIDYAWPAQRIAEIAAQFDVRALAFDRYKIEYLKRAMADAGVEYHDRGDAVGYGIELVEHGQGFRDMDPAIRIFESGVINGTTRIQRNPVTTMCAGNVTVVKDPAENRKLDKSKSTGRIDGIVAAVMVSRIAEESDDSERGTIYDDQDLMVA